MLEALWVHQYHNVVDVDLLEAGAGVARLPRPGRGGARAVLLARPRAGRARTAQESRGRRAPARAARSRPGRELLHRARGGRSRLHRARQAGRSVRQLTSRARRCGRSTRSSRRPSPRSEPIKFTTAAGARYFLKTVAHRRPAEDGAHAGASTWNCSSARACATSSAARRSPALAEAEKKTEVVRAARRDPRARRIEPRPRRASRSTWFACSPSQPRSELADARAGPRSAGHRRPQRPIDAADRLRRAHRGRRQRRQGVGSWRRSRSARCRTSSRPCRWSATRRCAPRCTRRSKALLDGLPPELAKTVGAEQGRRRPLRPHRAARQAADADAGRSRSLQRRRQRRPQGQGDAEQHRPRRRRGPGDRRQQERQLTATAARRTRRKATDNPWWEVDLGREVPIETIVVCNRTDGNLGDRLKNFTVTVLDAQTKEVFVSEEEPDADGEGRRSRSARCRRSESSARRRCSR